jgi:glyoxylase-like metal-dependent hydrolase (beta-lactamase superfamily II)
MKIHAIQTGTVAVTSAWREGIGHGRRRLLRAIVDREWTEPLPIYAFAIEHPEGVIVVDTGEDARASARSYFARWHPGLRAFNEWVEPDQEVGAQLKRLGIEPGDVRWVVLTHLHTDHAGGLQPFPQSLRLTEAGDVTLVPLPGHTPGQIGVLIDEGDHILFLAGDSSYTQELMLRGKADGVGADEEAERRTHERIRAYAAANPTVYLVAHDPDTGARLAERKLVHPLPLEVAA